MTRRWYIIDDAGWRRIDVAPQKKSGKRWDFWSEFRAGSPESTAWPAFAQVAVRAPAARVRRAIADFAAALEVGCRDVTHRPELWEQAIVLSEENGATQSAMTLIGERPVEADARLINGETVEAFFEALGADGAFYGHDPDAGTLMLSVFRAGALQFSWSDSIDPGPSYALSFEPDGRATAEDPRHFALRRLGHPPTSPFLDRYAFLEHELSELGVGALSPLLINRPITAAFCIDAADQSDDDPSQRVELKS